MAKTRMAAPLAVEDERNTAIVRVDDHDLVVRDHEAEVAQLADIIENDRRELVELDVVRDLAAESETQPQPRHGEVRGDAVEHYRSFMIGKGQLGDLGARARCVRRLI